VRSWSVVLLWILASPLAHADKKGKGTEAPKLRSVKTRSVDVETAPSTSPEEKGVKVVPKSLGFSRGQAVDPRDEKARQLSDKRVQLIRDLDELLGRAGPRYGARADRLYQKAELQWEEEKYQYHLRLEAHEPSTGQPEPRVSFAAAVATYRQILAEHAEFPQNDEVRFHLGLVLAEQADDVAAISVLEELVKKHPRSPYVPDAEVALGELFFARDMLDDAATHYGAVPKKHGAHPIGPFSRYKLGWTLYRMRRFDEAVAEMTRAIQEEEALRVPSRLPIREQALADLIVVWAETAGAWQEAAAYYEKKGGDAMLRRELYRFSRYLVGQGKGEEATSLLVWLSAKGPLRPELVSYDEVRFDVVRRGRRVEPAEAEAQRLVAFYGQGSAWGTAAARTSKERQEARSLAEKAAIFAANLRHESAQRQKDMAAYELAWQGYRRYLDAFPGGPQAGDATFRRAEIELLLGRHGDAGQSYAAASQKLGGELGDDAAYKAVYAFALAVKEAGLADDATPPPDRDPREPALAELAISEAEKNLVAAADAFVVRRPDTADGPEVRFLAARVLYLRLHLPEASRRFVDLVDQHPKSSRAGDAAALALDCYNRQRDFSHLVKWARRLIVDKRFDHLDEKSLHEIISGASAQAAYDLETQGDLAGAADVLVLVVKDNPRSAKNPDRITQAAKYRMRAGDRTGAGELYKIMVDKYPHSPLSTSAALALGALYEARGDVTGAAASYEKAADLPRVEGTADALYNAALLRETLGEGKKAAALYDRYARDFAERNDAPLVALRAAFAEEKGGEKAAALERYLTFAKKWPKASPEARAEAASHACQIVGKDAPAAKDAPKETKKARALCTEVVTAAKKAVAPPGSPLALAAARAALVLGDFTAAEMDAVKLELPEALLGKRVGEKLAKLDASAKAYLAVTEYGVPTFGAQAIVRVGEAYQRFAAALRQAPEPSGLAGDLLEAYRATISDRAGIVEENALGAFASVAKLAREGTITEATGAAAMARRKLDPSADPWLGEPEALPVSASELRAVDPWASPEGAKQESRLLIAQGKIQASRQLLEGTRKQRPADRAVALELARLRARTGDAAGARALLAGLEGELPVDARIVVALAWRELGEKEKALETVEAGLAADPTSEGGAKADRRLVVLAADLAREAGNRDRAHLVLEAILARDPREVMAWAALVRLLSDEGKPGAARYVGSRALGSGLSSAELHEALARAALAEGDVTYATVHLVRALDLDPGFGTAAARLGRVRLEHGDAKGAVAPLALAAGSYPVDGELHLALGAARRLDGDMEGAAQALDAALAILPKDPRALFAAAKINDEELSRPARALELYRRYAAARSDVLPETHPARRALRSLEKKQGGSK
jgi:TolA-binding protein/Flp pilus assembly protein TadD